MNTKSAWGARESEGTSEGPRKGSSGSWIERSKQGIFGELGVLAVKDFSRFRVRRRTEEQE
jgi:hypothetical protein